MSWDTLTVSAPAKINLALDVIRKRDDGYHDLRMIMQSVSLCDSLTFKLTAGGDVSVESDLPGLPRGYKNIAFRAVKLFFERAGIDGWGCHIEITKNIPVCAGMGGGSADAAAVLRTLQERFDNPLSDGELAALAKDVGSDVPFCLAGGTALAEGRGEFLTPLKPIPACHIVMCTPPTGVSTAVAFKELKLSHIKHRPDWSGMERAIAAGRLPDIARRCFNVFEEVTTKGRRDVTDIHSTMIEGGALGASMSGTGPTVFGIFEEESDARHVRDNLSDRYRQVYLSCPV